MAKKLSKKTNIETPVKEVNVDGGLKETEAKLESVDNILTKITKIVKKHWLILLFLLLVYGGYKFFVLVGEEMDKAAIVPSQQNSNIEKVSPAEQPYIVREYDEEQLDGTYLRILVWSDSVETVDENYIY